MANPNTTMLFGFHAVRARLRYKPDSIKELYIEQSRRDKRMQDFCALAQTCGVETIPVPVDRLEGLSRGQRHQGVVAIAQAVSLAHSVDEVLDVVQGPPLLLILDGVTDPHNLGACLRVADAAGVHAVIAPKDRAVGLGAIVAKVASGAAETVPYIMVTNLARTLRELKERDIWIVGTSDEATNTLYEADFVRPTAIVMGAEGQGMRHLTTQTCDQLISIPMAGSVESLNVSVASGVVLYEAVRQRRVPS